MFQTVNSLQALPSFTPGETLTAEWVEIRDRTTTDAQLELISTLEYLRRITGIPLLSNTQFLRARSTASDFSLGALRVVPDDTYLKKIARPPCQEHRFRSLDKLYHYPLLLGLDLDRRFLAKQVGMEHHPATVRCYIKILPGHEFNTFSKIFTNYRGVVGKLVEFGNLELGMGDFLSKRSKEILAKLDDVFRGTQVAPEDRWFALDFTWHHYIGDEEGLRAIAALAALFTAIQKSGISQRSKNDYLLDYWMKLSRLKALAS